MQAGHSLPRPRLLPVALATVRLPSVIDDSDSHRSCDCCGDPSIEAAAMGSRNSRYRE